MDRHRDACRDQRGRLAVAAIGRLSDGEHAALAAHVEGCRRCRMELDELTATARVLDEVEPSRTGFSARPRPTPWRRHRVMARPRVEGNARRRPRRWMVAAVVALVVVGLLIAVVDPHAGSGERVELAGPSGVEASAVLEPRRWGTAIRLEVRGLEPGASYRVWLRAPNGARVAAGSFTAPADGAIDVTTGSALPPTHAIGVGISSGGATVVYGHLDE